jgi:hypothetical protein
MSWADLSSEDAAEGDAASDVTVSASELAAAVTDPDLAVPVDLGVAPLIVPALVDVASTDTAAGSVVDTTTGTTDTTSTTDSVPAPPALLP